MKANDESGNLDLGATAVQMATAMKNPNAHESFGLNFILKNKKDVLINDNAVLEIFSAISRVDLMPLKPEKPMPEEGADQAVIDQVNADNEQIRAHNDTINKLKAKISLQVPREKFAKPEDAEEWAYPEDPSDFSFWKEKCYVKVQNFKDESGQVVNEEVKHEKKLTAKEKEAEKARLAAQAEADPNAEPPFEIEKISNKIMIIPCQNNASNVSLFVHHTGKQLESLNNFRCFTLHPQGYYRACSKDLVQRPERDPHELDLGSLRFQEQSPRR